MESLKEVSIITSIMVEKPFVISYFRCVVFPFKFQEIGSFLDFGIIVSWIAPTIQCDLYKLDSYFMSSLKF